MAWYNKELLAFFPRAFVIVPGFRTFVYSEQDGSNDSVVIVLNPPDLSGLHHCLKLGDFPGVENIFVGFILEDILDSVVVNKFAQKVNAIVFDNIHIEQSVVPKEGSDIGDQAFNMFQFVFSCCTLASSEIVLFAMIGVNLCVEAVLVSLQHLGRLIPKFVDSFLKFDFGALVLGRYKELFESDTTVNSELDGKLFV